MKRMCQERLARHGICPDLGLRWHITVEFIILAEVGRAAKEQEAGRGVKTERKKRNRKGQKQKGDEKEGWRNTRRVRDTRAERQRNTGVPTCANIQTG